MFVMLEYCYIPRVCHAARLAEELKNLAAEDRKRGGVGSMNAMVREAIND